MEMIMKALLMCQRMPSWSNKTALRIIHLDNSLYPESFTYCTEVSLSSETAGGQAEATEVKGKGCGLQGMIFGGATSSCRTWWRWRCMQQPKRPQSLLSGGCSGHLPYLMFTEDRVPSPAQMGATCFCANILNLGALCRSQSIMSWLNRSCGPEPCHCTESIPLCPRSALWRQVHRPGTQAETSEVSLWPRQTAPSPERALVFLWIKPSQGLVSWKCIIMICMKSWLIN